MSTSYTASMFEKIKESLNNKSGSSGFKDIIKFKPGNTYIVRLLPNIHDAESTLFAYSTFGWTSRATGQYMSVVSPLSFGERCPVSELRYKLYQGTESDIKLAKMLKKNQQWLVNCLVVKNPTAPETEGQVKMIRFGKQLHKIMSDAISGDDADEFGMSIFDVSKDGNNLRVKVEKNEGGYPSYISSKFLKACAIDGVEDGEEDAVNEKTFDLSKIIQVRSFDEIKEIINVHLLNEPAAGAKEEPKVEVETETEEKVEKSKASAKPTTEGEEEITDEDIEDLLKDL